MDCECGKCFDCKMKQHVRELIRECRKLTKHMFETGKLKGTYEKFMEGEKEDE